MNEPSACGTQAETARETRAVLYRRPPSTRFQETRPIFF
jgi:hypothetical protein